MATQRSSRDADEEASCGDNNNWRLSLAMGVGCICAILLFSDGFSWSENLVVDVDALDVGASEPTAPWFDATPDDTPNAFAAAAAVGVVERKAGVSAAALDPATSLDGGVRGVTEVDEVLSALDGEGGGEKQGDATHQAYLDRTAAEAAAAVPKGGSGGGGGGNATGRSAVVLAAYKEDYAWWGGLYKLGFQPTRSSIAPVCPTTLEPMKRDKPGSKCFAMGQTCAATTWAQQATKEMGLDLHVYQSGDKNAPNFMRNFASEVGLLLSTRHLRRRRGRGECCPATSRLGLHSLLGVTRLVTVRGPYRLSPVGCVMHARVVTPGGVTRLVTPGTILVPYRLSSTEPCFGCTNKP
jgi:hypothetical protein